MFACKKDKKLKKNEKLDRCYLKAELVLKHIFLGDARDSLVFKFTRIIHLEYWWFMSKYCLNSKLCIPNTINTDCILWQLQIICSCFNLKKYTSTPWLTRIYFTWISLTQLPCLTWTLNNTILYNVQKQLSVLPRPSTTLMAQSAQKTASV